MKIHLCHISECVGCGACLSICPKSAITMKEDDFGFLYPSIDNSICISCNLCAKTCQLVTDPSILSSPFKYYKYEANSNIRLQSSSGGFFTFAAEWAINHGWFVCGAVYENNFQNVKLSITKNKQELQFMRKSKYIASNTFDVYKKIGHLLKQGSNVLFFGLPCQVSGLKSYLKSLSCNFAGLVTVDLLCHGSGSPKIWKLNLEDFCRENNFRQDDIINVDFRPKPENQGRQIQFTMKTKKYTLQSKDFPYYYGFENRYLLRKSCYSCFFWRNLRVGDLTIGDMVPLDIEGYGRSLVLVNTQQGDMFLDCIRFKEHGLVMSDEEKYCNLSRLKPKIENVHAYRKKLNVSDINHFRKIKRTYLNSNWIPAKYKVKRKIYNLIRRKDKNE